MKRYCITITYLQKNIVAQCTYLIWQIDRFPLIREKCNSSEKMNSLGNKLNFRSHITNNEAYSKVNYIYIYELFRNLGIRYTAIKLLNLHIDLMATTVCFGIQ